MPLEKEQRQAQEAHEQRKKRRKKQENQEREQCGREESDMRYLRFRRLKDLHDPNPEISTNAVQQLTSSSCRLDTPFTAAKSTSHFELLKSRSCNCGQQPSIDSPRNSEHPAT